MQPVSVLDLHEHANAHVGLHPKYHHHHVHPKYSHHVHNHHDHHHHHSGHSAGDEQHHQSQHTDPEQDDSGGMSPEQEATEHKMIDLIYNDGQKTVMYTHDKEIIYESEADRVQVVEYPPPPPSPPTPSPPATSTTSSGTLIPVNYVAKTSATTATTLHLHYPQFSTEQHLPRALVNGTTLSGVPTTATVLVLSELVDPAVSSPIALATSSLRSVG